MPDDGVLTLTTGGQVLSGWQTIRVSRSCEAVPSSFDLTLTERYPGDAGEAQISPGGTCEIRIGADLVLTGYIDQRMLSIAPEQHEVRVVGRSAVQDLVECSADLPRSTVNAGTFLSIAQGLAAPYGIDVHCRSPVGGQTFPAFSVVPQETPYEIIERVARYLRVLVYDDTDGSLLLVPVGDGGTMASGFKQGVNVQGGSATFTMNERYSAYTPNYLGTADVLDMRNQVNPSAPVPGRFPDVIDAEVPTVGIGGKARKRNLVVVSEQIDVGNAGNPSLIVQQRAEWEAARRRGRSKALQVVVDSWRDQKGALWRPNAYAPIDMPVLKLSNENWVIGSVTFARDQQQGTTAELILMPKEAFSLEPTVLTVIDAATSEALQEAATGDARRLQTGTQAP